MLDVGSALRHVLQRVARQDQLVLLGLGNLNVNTGAHDDPADQLLADEVATRPPHQQSQQYNLLTRLKMIQLLQTASPCSPRKKKKKSPKVRIETGMVHNVPDLDLPNARLRVLVQVDVDGEMGVDIAHLVLVALGDADDQVVDDRPDGAEGGDILAAAVVDLDVDDVLAGLREVDGDVAQALGELSCKVSIEELPRQKPISVTRIVVSSVLAPIRSPSHPPLFFVHFAGAGYWTSVVAGWWWVWKGKYLWGPRR